MMKKVYLIFALIATVGLILRLWRLDIPLLEFYPTRQVQTAEITRNFYYEGFNLLRPTVNYLGPDSRLFLVEFPGYNFIVALLYRMAGGPYEFLGRGFSVLGWLVSLIALFAIAKKMCGTWVALVASFFYAFSPLSILTSRSFQPDQWMLTFSLLSLLLLLKSRRSRLGFFLSALFMSLAVLTKLPAVIFTLVPVGYLMSTSKKYLPFDKFVYLIIAAVPSFIWYLYVAVVNSNVSNLVNQTEISTWFGAELLINIKYFSNMFGFEYDVGLMPIGILLFFAGLAIKLKRDQYLLYWWLAGVTIYFLIFNKHSMTHEYYHLPFLPIAAIFIGIGASRIIGLYKSLVVPRGWLLVAGSSLLVLLMLPPTLGRAYKPIDRFKYVPETGRAIQRLTTPTDLIIGSMDGGPTLVYYSQRRGWLFDVQLKSLTENDPVEKLEKLRGAGAKIFASANKVQFNSNKIFSTYLYENYNVLEETDNYVLFDIREKNAE